MHVISSLSASGGAEHGLVREVTLFGPDIEQLVVTLYPPNALGGSLTSAGIEVQELGLDSSSSGWNWALATRRLKSVISAFRPDVVQSSLASANLAAQMAARASMTPILSTFTLSGDPSLMRRLQPGAASRRAAVLRRVEARSARGSHVWFRSLTRDAATTSCAAMGLDIGRVTVIPRGVPLPDGPAPDRSALGLPNDMPIMLNVGRQTAQKGHLDLIQVLAEVRRDLEAHLVILGREGDGTTALKEAVAKSGLEDSISIIPYTGQTYDYYRSADVFVFPSLMEGLGTAVLEAMACRLPVVASDIPPIAEIAKTDQLAVLTPPGDTRAMAAQVRDVLTSPAIAMERADRAFSVVASKYAPEQIAHAVESRLRELASGAAS